MAPLSKYSTAFAIHTPLELDCLYFGKAGILHNKIVCNFVSKMAIGKTPPLSDLFGMFPYMGYRRWVGIKPVELYYVHSTIYYFVDKQFQQFADSAQESSTVVSVWL